MVLVPYQFAYPSVGKRVAVQGYKKVALILVGNVRAFLPVNVFLSAACQYGLYTVHLFFYRQLQFKSYSQRYISLKGIGTRGDRQKVTNGAFRTHAMSRIDNNGLYFVPAVGNCILVRTNT